MRQAGLANVGLVLAPADDWLAIQEDHLHISVFRAVENGFSLVRPTSKGVSAAVDPLGRELAKAEYYAADRLAIVAAVPVLPLPTLYSRIGDVFAYGCVLALLASIALAFRRAASTGAQGPAHVKASATAVQRDTDQARERVSVGSQIAETPRRPIEYATAGDGPPILVVHGAGGGYDQGLDVTTALVQSGFRVVARSRSALGFPNTLQPLKH